MNLPTTKAQHLKALRRCTEVASVCRTSCCICDEAEEEEDTTESDFVLRLYRDGWRYGASKVYQMEGIMCPKCYNTPDDKREEMLEGPCI